MFEIEIYTAEVKPSIMSWKSWIFEAVSHSRFSERCYFIFRSDGEVTELVADLIDYAERFGIGIAVIEIDDDQYTSLIK